MMKSWLLALFLIVCMTSSANCDVEMTPMLEMLDAMQQMMTGEEFDRDFYDEFTTCIDFIDPAIKLSQDGAWQGIMDYWDTRGTIEDPWGQKTTSYIEYNVTTTEIRGMTIYEPCGYASNVAYYYPVTEMCSRFVNGTPYSTPIAYIQSMAKGFCQLAMGSAFMHGTHTRLGGQQDNKPLASLAYQFHQASLDTLERSPILHDLDYSFRQYTAFEMIESLDYMYTNMDVTEWEVHTDNLFIPSYYLIYSGIVCSIMTLTLDPALVDAIIPIAADAFGVSDDIVVFIEDYYVPELRNATAELDLNIIQRTRLIGNSIGTLVKLIYAFLWQESILTDNSIFFTPEANQLGIDLLPEVNRLASSIQSFDHFNQDFQNGSDIYPGDAYCNPALPHPTWHLQSAIGLLDMVHLCDEIHKTLDRL